MLKTFSECPHKYYLRYVERIAVPQKPGIFEKGKELHALAHYYLRGDDISKFEHPLWEQLKSNEYFQKNYVASEYNLSCRIGGFWVGGRLDALVRDDTGYYILDYKTGAVPKQNDFQTPVYMLAAQKFYTPVKFVYIGLRENKNVVVENVDETFVVQTCEKIAGAKNFSRCESACRYCEFSKICVQ
jgi:CRISPR/Cas system-associated exonuclease Cas4 (RecB family)